MELMIDNRRCDLTPGACAVPRYEAAALADVEACRTGRQLRITIPATAANDALVGFARDPQGAVHFNDTLHTASLCADGAELIGGTVRLLESSGEGYLLEIRDGGARWADNAARRMFNTLGVEWQSVLTPTAICASWSDASPVKFFPIRRDEYPQQNSSADLLPAERMLSVDDYHPFLHVGTLVSTIFDEAGYRIRSQFMASPFFQSLYMSGAYPSHDTAAATAAMGFSARRLGQATAQANHLGRVYASPDVLYNTVGNLVETAAPQSVDADGETVQGLYNNGNCFGMEGPRIVFTPTTEVSVSFEYDLRYTTQHRILSRTQLRGFDTVYLGPGSEMAFCLANRYEDRRAEIALGRAYRAIVFGHADGASYRLTYTRNGVAGSLWADFAARTAAVETPASGMVADPVLLVRSGNAWTPYAGDWALYDGYVAETGETTVCLRVHTASETVSASSPKRFNQIYFSGAEEGMTFTLDKRCSLRPRFLSSPGFGSAVSFADVAQHRVRQSALLEALGHLFNLRWWTEQATRTVWIEPEEVFFGAGPEVDWRSKTDFSHSVVFADLAAEVHETRTWCYEEGDGAVKRLNAAGESPLGEWTAETDSYAALRGEQRLVSPLFRPTVSSAGGYLNAPSAQLMQVGDRDQAEQDGSNFTPRIVCFAGLHPLPENERWGSPWSVASYPLAAFHFAGDDAVEPFTLCFEDRDGAQGLHRYYDRQVAQQARGGRVTLSLHLAPHEYEALFTPGTGAADLRSVFRIDTGQEVVRATLDAIEPYDAEAASVRCTFTRLFEP